MDTFQRFSAIQRKALVAQMAGIHFDIVVFGGGITGAGIALDAADRGLLVALFENNDFASGTSSRSTKLVHGGLRYLEKLQFRFVAQLGKERKILHDNATHNVIPVPVLLPIVKGGQLKRSLSWMGLLIYDWLAGVKKEYRTQWIPKQELLNKYPFMNSAGLKGAYRYYEYKTNDGRLVIETLKKAVDEGALAINFCQPLELMCTQGRASGIKIHDLIQKQEFVVKAKCFINATGPWCSEFMLKLDEGISKKLFPTKGVHLVVSHKRFPISEAFYFDTQDRRMIFAIPRQQHVYIGTTDTPFIGDLRHPRLEKSDLIYLLESVNEKFKGLQLTDADVVSCWSGLRPLIQEVGKKPSEISRKEELFVSRSGIISITGGKLTGYRLMAKTTVDLIFKQLHLPRKACNTHQIRVSGSQWQNPPEMKKLVEIADQYFDFAKQTGISVASFKKLFYRYGTNIDVITEKAYEWLRTELDAEKLWLKAEVWYSVTHEMTADLSGFFIYRTEMVLFEPQQVTEQLPFVAGCMAGLLQWDSDETDKQINQFQEHWKEYQR